MQKTKKKFKSSLIEEKFLISFSIGFFWHNLILNFYIISETKSLDNFNMQPIVTFFFHLCDVAKWWSFEITFNMSDDGPSKDLAFNDDKF